MRRTKIRGGFNRCIYRSLVGSVPLTLSQMTQVCCNASRLNLVTSFSVGKCASGSQIAVRGCCRLRSGRTQESTFHCPRQSSYWEFRTMLHSRKLSKDSPTTNIRSSPGKETGGTNVSFSSWNVRFSICNSRATCRMRIRCRAKLKAQQESPRRTAPKFARKTFRCMLRLRFCVETSLRETTPLTLLTSGDRLSHFKWKSAPKVVLCDSRFH